MRKRDKERESGGGEKETERKKTIGQEKYSRMRNNNISLNKMAYICKYL